MCVKIPLFQAIKDVPIYAKKIKESCLKKPIRKPKDAPIVHLVGQLENSMLEKSLSNKYKDPRNPTVVVFINKISIPNTLVVLGVAINIMTKEILKTLGLTNLGPIPTILELADCSTVKPEGNL